jgi:hypothetical protein
MSDGPPRAGIVELIVPGEAAGAAGVSVWWWVAAFAVLLVLLLYVVRRMNRRDPLRTAYLKMARAGRLSREERRALERLAGEFSAPPAALLLAPRSLGAKCGRNIALKSLSLRLIAQSSLSSKA